MKRAFTLIELLLTIFITIVLIGIILPAFSKSSALARRTKCQSQLLSLAQTTIIYLDNHKILPLSHEFPDDIDLEVWDVPSAVWICPAADNRAKRTYSYLAGAFMQHSLTTLDPDPATAREVTGMYQRMPGLALLEDAEHFHLGASNEVRLDGSVYTRR